VEAAAEDLGEGGDGAGLGQAGDALQQQVPPGQQRHQDPFQHPLLAHDHPLDLKQRRLELRTRDRVTNGG